ncbi:hypothetical protein MPTK2_5g22920 [Marchantia polymorpha subsp. ruderalis]
MRLSNSDENPRRLRPQLRGAVAGRGPTPRGGHHRRIGIRQRQSGDEPARLACERDSAHEPQEIQPVAARLQLPGDLSHGHAPMLISFPPSPPPFSLPPCLHHRDHRPLFKFQSYVCNRRRHFDDDEEECYAKHLFLLNQAEHRDRQTGSSHQNGTRPSVSSLSC